MEAGHHTSMRGHGGAAETAAEPTSHSREHTVPPTEETRAAKLYLSAPLIHMASDPGQSWKRGGITDVFTGD